MTDPRSRLEELYNFAGIDFGEYVSGGGGGVEMKT